MLYRQVCSQFQGKRKIPFVLEDHEISHGRSITWTLRAKQAPTHIDETWVGTSWIVEVTATGKRAGKPFLGAAPVPHQPANHARGAAATGARSLNY